MSALAEHKAIREARAGPSELRFEEHHEAAIVEIGKVTAEDSTRSG